LEQAGVLVRSAVEVDLNNAGQAEWVLLVDTPGADAPVEIWILLKTPGGVSALKVVS
jgi:hypothetical protein